MFRLLELHAVFDNGGYPVTRIEEKLHFSKFEAFTLAQNAFFEFLSVELLQKRVITVLRVDRLVHVRWENIVRWMKSATEVTDEGEIEMNLNLKEASTVDAALNHS